MIPPHRRCEKGFSHQQVSPHRWCEKGFSHQREGILAPADRGGASAPKGPRSVARGASPWSSPAPSRPAPQGRQSTNATATPFRRHTFVDVPPRAASVELPSSPPFRRHAPWNRLRSSRRRGGNDSPTPPVREGILAPAGSPTALVRERILAPAGRDSRTSGSRWRIGPEGATVCSQGRKPLVKSGPSRPAPQGRQSTNATATPFRRYTFVNPPPQAASVELPSSPPSPGGGNDSPTPPVRERILAPAKSAFADSPLSPRSVATPLPPRWGWRVILAAPNPGADAPGYTPAPLRGAHQLYTRTFPG